VRVRGIVNSLLPAMKKVLRSETEMYIRQLILIHTFLAAEYVMPYVL
jgi:hypothetical protein